MRSYNENVAYDLSRFERREITRLPVKKAKKKRLNVSISSFLSTAFLVVLALSVTAMMIFSRVELTELTAQINKAEKELNQLKNENIKLNIEAESQISLSKVEEYAKNVLGMKKLQNYQVEYVCLTQQDKVEIKARDKDSIFNKYLQLSDN